ncbi:transcription factor 12-like isoform X2 [Anneissia japonica]|uniref:transcription factor 12-like isoform X2 n=1 Tax=Anneissia japonica TaxID=1529436 RepID=UPI001425539F|nr:transcription factor 12-like isoform X2 [Anneissia japonica]
MKDMMQSPNGRVPMVSDKELSDLLDFSAMFSPPTGSSKNVQPGQPTQGPPYNKPGMENNSSTWSNNGARPSPNYESQSRNYEYGDMNDRGIDGSYAAGKKEPSYGMSYSMSREPSLPQQAQSITPLGMPSSGSLSPHAKATAPYYSIYNPSRRRPMPEQPPIPPQTGLGGKRRKQIGVYSPAGSDDYHSESPSYSSPKPPGMYSDSYYLDGSHNSGHDGWSNGIGPASNYPSSTLLSNSTSHSQTSSNFTHDPPMNFGHSQESLMSSNSGLPPMTSFRPDAHPSARSPLNGSEPSQARRSSTTATGADNSQTGVTLGKALASIYSSEQTNSSYPSNPSTPVSSPPPMTGPWPRSGSQPSPSASGYAGGAGPVSTTVNTSGENQLHSLSRMEECLNDAIHVLQRHAELPAQGMNPMAPGIPPGMINGLPPHSSSGMPPGMSHPYGHPSQYGVEHPHMGGPPSSVPDNHRSSVSGPPLPPSEIAQPQQPFSLQNDLMGHDDDGLKIEKVKSKSVGAKPKKEEKMDISKPEDSKSSDSNRSNNSGKTKKRTTDDLSLDGEVPKVEKEKERRSANNARERIRVRDINEAFKELGRMCQLHLNTDKAQTKLLILHQAVNVITSLESQVRDRNLNPKAACLKRREEEKVDELPNRGLGPAGDHLGPQHGLQGSSNLLGGSIPGGLSKSVLQSGFTGIMDSILNQHPAHLQQMNEYGIHHGLDLTQVPASSSTVTTMSRSLEIFRGDSMQTSASQIAHEPLTPEDNLSA